MTIERPLRVAAVVLAAGRSLRMGDANKLLVPVDGVPLIARVVGEICTSRAAPVVVVTGHDEARVRAALPGVAVSFAHNPGYAAGLSTSLATGITALPTDIDGTVVCLGDMPWVTASVIDRLIAAFEPADGRAICLPVYRGRRGNPVLWARRFFAEMAALTGDAGARRLIDEHAVQVFEVESDDDSVLIDIDTPSALAALAEPR